MMASIMVGAGSAVTAISAMGQADSSIVLMAAGPGTAVSYTHLDQQIKYHPGDPVSVKENSAFILCLDSI